MRERVQNKFLKYASHSLKMIRLAHNYSLALYRLNLVTIVNRRQRVNLNFLINPLNCQIESPSLLFLILFKIPVRSTSQYVPLELPSFSTNYGSNKPLRRYML